MRAAPVELNPRSGVVLNTQRKTGRNENYVAVAYNNAAVLPDGGGGSMQFAYTPPVPVWWAVEAGISICQKMDANYNIIYHQLLLTPADQDGINWTQMVGTQHSQVQTYNSRLVRRLYRLAAGVSYTVQLILGSGNGGTWNYYQGTSHFWLEATAWTQ